MTKEIQNFVKSLAELDILFRVTLGIDDSEQFLSRKNNVLDDKVYTCPETIFIPFLSPTS